MLRADMLKELQLHHHLIEAVSERIEGGHYSDAILAAFRHLTDVLREKSGFEGDGAQLAGQALGGTTPVIKLNPLRSTSEKDEQKGIEQLIRGLYMAIRNPRSHENLQDTEDFCIRVLLMVDTILSYLDRDLSGFRVDEFVDRIFDPHFVSTVEYAEVLVSAVPQSEALEVFRLAFSRRSEGKGDEIKHVFHALYEKMPSGDVSIAMQIISDDLRKETETKEIAKVFRMIREDMWELLADDVRLRTENLVIGELRKGRYNAYGGLQSGGLGSWGNRFGRYFKLRKELAAAIIEKLHIDWYTQNYIGTYYMNSLPLIIRGPEGLEKAAEAIAHAVLVNKATVVRQRLKEACANYPDRWKEVLRVALQENADSDPEYAKEVIDLLTVS